MFECPPPSMVDNIDLIHFSADLCQIFLFPSMFSCFLTRRRPIKEKCPSSSARCPWTTSLTQTYRASIRRRGYRARIPTSRPSSHTSREWQSNRQTCRSPPVLCWVDCHAPTALPVDSANRSVAFFKRSSLTVHYWSLRGSPRRCPRRRTSSSRRSTAVWSYRDSRSSWKTRPVK